MCKNVSQAKLKRHKLYYKEKRKKKERKETNKYRRETRTRRIGRKEELCENGSKTKAKWCQPYYIRPLKRGRKKREKRQAHK